MDSSLSDEYDDLARRAEARAPDDRMRDSVLRTARRFAPLGFVMVVFVIVVAVVGRRMPSDDDASTTADGLMSGTMPSDVDGGDNVAMERRATSAFLSSNWPLVHRGPYFRSPSVVRAQQPSGGRGGGHGQRPSARSRQKDTRLCHLP